MDLSTLDTRAAAETGATLELVNPATGEILRQALPEDAAPGTDAPAVTLTLAGQDSPRYKKARNQQVTKRLARRTPGKITAEDAEAEGLDVICACVMGWEGILDRGEALPCTDANVRRIFAAYPWIREQADTFIHDRANYLAD